MISGENGPVHDGDELPALDEILRAAIDRGVLPLDCPPQPEHAGEMPDWARAAVAARGRQSRRTRVVWRFGFASAAGIAIAAVVFSLQPAELELPDLPEGSRPLLAVDLLPQRDKALAFSGAASRPVPEICLGYAYEALADHETGHFGDATVRARQRAGRLRLQFEKTASAWVADREAEPGMLSALLDKGPRRERARRATMALERVDPAARARFRLGRWLYLGASSVPLSGGQARAGAEMLQHAMTRSDALDGALDALSDETLNASQRSSLLAKTAQHLCAGDAR